MNLEDLIIKHGYTHVQISQDSRRTDYDALGRKLKLGNYTMWNYYLTNKRGDKLKNLWPGFLDVSEMFEDLKNKLYEDEKST